MRRIAHRARAPEDAFAAGPPGDEQKRHPPPDPDASVKPRTLADFVGLWRLQRWIAHEHGPPFRFEGQVEFRRHADQLLQEERGLLQTEGRPAFPARRRYLWGAGLWVRFEDGRPFHRVPAQGGTARHDCPPDRYLVRYDFGTWPVWRTTWQVTGPRKTYVMQSVLSPA